jgi:hypothetical protein
MRLDDITVDMLKKALDIYVAAAYQQAPLPLTVKSRVAVFREYPGADLKDLLALDVIERTRSESDPAAVISFGVRLGNEKYPHMKLTIRRQEGVSPQGFPQGPRVPSGREAAREDDWRFCVDSHDSAFELESTNPDALKAQELKDFNQELKGTIEALWREADLPAAEEA